MSSCSCWQVELLFRAGWCSADCGFSDLGGLLTAGVSFLPVPERVGGSVTVGQPSFLFVHLCVGACTKATVHMGILSFRTVTD